MRNKVFFTIIMSFLGTTFAEVGPNWIEQWGIRWTFDKNISSDGIDNTYQYGQFINGDYWIVGPANIIQISPGQTTIEQDGKTFIVDGSMINPSNLSPGPDTISAHGFDGRAPHFKESLCIKAPYLITPVSSLISAVSWRIGETGCPARYTEIKYALRPTLKKAAILTCLSEAPESVAFRPAYCGQAVNKIIHYVNEMNLSILPNLKAVSGTPNFHDTSTWDTWLSSINKPWLDFITSWDGEPIHPSEHMPNYGRDIAKKINDIALFLLLDTNTITFEQKKMLSIQLIQLGIDFYGIISNEGGWGHIGGGIGQGRKLPILFAGAALNYTPYKNIGKSHGYNDDPSKCHLYFMEDNQIFYITQEDIDRYGVKSKVATRTNCSVSENDPTLVIDFDGGKWYLADDGTTEIQSRNARLNYDYWLVWNYGSPNEEYSRIIQVDATDQSKVRVSAPLTPGQGKTARVQLFPQGRLGMPDWVSGGPSTHWESPEWDWYSRTYRFCCTGNSLAGAQLFALAVSTRDGISIRELWNWDPFFDYMDMYMTEKHSALWTRQMSTFAANMWDTYRKDYGPIWPATTSEAVTYNLTVNTKDCSVNRTPNKTNYASGEKVTLTAQPLTGYRFSTWTGEASGTDASITITMDSNKTVTAICEPNPTEGQVLHAPLDDGSGTTITDANHLQAGNLIGGSLWGAEWRDEDWLGFNQSTQAITIPTMGMSPQAGTVAVWVEPTDFSGMKFIFGHVLNNGNRLSLYTVAGSLAVGLGANATLKTNITPLPLNQPVHLALSWEATAYTVYVNGVQKAAGTFGGLTALNTFIDIGNYGDPAFRSLGFAGKIDDIRTYNRALAAEEIDALYLTQDVRQGKELKFTVNAVNAQGIPIVYQAATMPSGASFDAATQLVKWTPWHNQLGLHTFRFTSAGQTEKVVTVEVHPSSMTSWYRSGQQQLTKVR